MKITVVGAGNVGATTLQRLAQMELAEELVVVDILEGTPQGKALDMHESTPVLGSSSNVIGTNDYKDTAGSDIVIITAGQPRTPGMSRDDLLMKNNEIVSGCTKSVMEYSPDAILLVVSNPLDVMCSVAHHASGLPPNKVIGMAGILDSTRFRSFLSTETNISVRDIQTLVLGGHGDSMVPLVRYTTVAGIPISELIDAKRIEEIVDRTRKGGIEIVNFLKTGSAYYAPAVAVAEMAEAIVKNQRRLLPCSALLNGEYGVKGIFMGVPCILGSNGLEEIVELKITDDEKAALKKSADHVQSVLDRLNI
ncbi:malate dehydrogenase [Candidatus Neomarinimicrobiota bacterium]